MTIVVQFIGVAVLAIIIGVGAYKVIDYLTPKPPKPPKE